MKDYPQPRAARTCAALVTGEAQSALRHTAPPIPGRGDRPAGGRAIAWTIKPLVAAIIAALAAPALAAPKGGVVVAGSASIGQSGNTTTINQSGQRVAINWTNFSVGAGEAVRFKQPNAAAMALNRVTGRESSAILGSLTANGQVFIVNPNGILFGKGAQVNVGGLVATTLGISNQDFMAGNFRFSGNAGGSVVNEGHITVAPGGTLALIAPLVTNSGTLSAPGGSVLLAAGEAVTLTLLDGSPLAYTLDKGSVQALVDNGGIIQADGGHVVLTAQGVDSLSRAAVNHSGVIEARTVGEKSGVIELFADQESGQVSLVGKLDASAPNGGNGGFIETSAAKVAIADSAGVTTLAAKGKTGTWLIDPTDFAVEAGDGVRTVSSIGSRTLAKILEGSGVIIATDYSIATAPGGSEHGDITINAPILWTADTTLTLQAHRDIHINQFITATGNHAGLVLGYGVGRNYYLDGGAQVNLTGTAPTLKIGVAGSEEIFTVIKDLNGLQAINNFGGSNRYALGTDIDASATATWNGLAGFIPIGRSAILTGHFDGFNHTITNLHINRPSETNVGLFGVSSGIIRDVGLDGGSVSGFSNVGALVGGNLGTVDHAHASTSVFRSGHLRINGAVGGLIGGNSGIVKNSAASGRVTGGLGGYAGGLVGDNLRGGTVTGSHATGVVRGMDDFHVGGLVGSNKGAITESYATGEVIANASMGGLVGVNYPTGTITRSYATGAVTATGVTQVPITGGVGGLVGQAGDDYRSGGGIIRDSYATGLVRDLGDRSPYYVIYHDGGLVGMTLSNTTIINSYSSSEISGSGEGSQGGLIGYIYNPNSITNSYWDTEASGRATSAGGVGKTTAQMKQQATFTGWDFTNTWRMTEGVSAPVLRIADEAAAQAAAVRAAEVRAAAVQAAADQAAAAAAAAAEAAAAAKAAADAKVKADKAAADSKAAAEAKVGADKADVDARVAAEKAREDQATANKAADDAKVAADAKLAAEKLATDTKAAADALAAAVAKRAAWSDTDYSADHPTMVSAYMEQEPIYNFELYASISTSDAKGRYDINFLESLNMNQLRVVQDHFTEEAGFWLPLPEVAKKYYRAEINKINMIENVVQSHTPTLFSSVKDGSQLFLIITSAICKVASGAIVKPNGHFAEKKLKKLNDAFSLLAEVGGNDMAMRLLDVTTSGLDGDGEAALRSLFFGKLEYSELAPDKLIKVMEAATNIVFRYIEEGGEINAGMIREILAALGDFASDFIPAGAGKVSAKAAVAIIETYDASKNLSDKIHKSQWDIIEMQAQHYRALKEAVERKELIAGIMYNAQVKATREEQQILRDSGLPTTIGTF